MLFFHCSQTDKSTSRKVTLKDVSLRTSGKYKCEVSAEAPSFHTDSGTGQLLVVREYLPAFLLYELVQLNYDKFFTKQRGKGHAILV